MNVALGRGPSPPDPNGLRLTELLGGKLPTVASAHREWSWKLRPTPTARPEPKAFDDYNNATVANCTCTGLANGSQVVAEHNQDPEAELEQADVDAGFNAIANRDRTGASMLHAAQYYRKRGDVAGFARLDEDNRKHVELVIALYGGVYFGANLPIAAQKQSIWSLAPAGHEDDPIYKPGSWGGHAAWAISFDQTGVWIVTWGKLKFATWPWWHKHVDEAYVILFRRWMRFGAAIADPTPSGYLTASLVHGLARIGRVL